MVDESHTPEWRVVPGFPDYEVSNVGAVRRCAPDRLRYRRKTFDAGYIVKQRLNKYGYYSCVLFREGVGQSTLLVHRLVCLAFHGDCPADRPLAAHWNGVRHDNRVANLRWASHRENSADMLRHGTKCIGPRHARSKLNAQLVNDLRADYLRCRSFDEMVIRFNLPKSTISNAVYGVTWNHVPGAVASQWKRRPKATGKQSLQVAPVHKESLSTDELNDRELARARAMMGE